MDSLVLKKKTDLRAVFYYQTKVKVTFEEDGDVLLPAGIYTFAVKSQRDVNAPLLAMATVTLQVESSSVSAELNFGTESVLAYTNSKKYGAWLEISTADTVVFQQICMVFPRVHDESTPAPTPVTIYYTAAEVDALLAALPAPTVTSVNGKAGAVVLDAGDVGAVADSGRLIEALTASAGVVTVPAAEDKVYTCALTGGEEIALSAPAAGRMTTVELHFAMPSTAVSFTFRDTILWSNSAELFSSSAAAPDFSEGGVEYAVILRHDGTAWLGNLAYTKEL